MKGRIEGHRLGIVAIHLVLKHLLFVSVFILHKLTISTCLHCAGAAHHVKAHAPNFGHVRCHQLVPTCTGNQSTRWILLKEVEAGIQFGTPVLQKQKMGNVAALSDLTCPLASEGCP